MGTVFRLRRLLERYRGVGYDEEALWLLGRAYVAVALPDRARVTWSELVDKFPKSTRAGDARSALAGMHMTVLTGAKAVTPAAAPLTAPAAAPPSAPAAIPSPAAAAGSVPAPAPPPQQPGSPN
jgi:hypothetical protein